MTSTQTEPTPGLGVLEKMTRIIDAFEDGPERLLLEDVADMAGLPKSTTFRLLRQLAALGWVEHGGVGYHLGPRLAASRGLDPGREHIRAAASVPLADLHLATDAVCHLSVIDGGMMHFLDKVGGRAFGSVPSRVGARLRVTDSVSGLVILAAMTPEEAEATVRANGPCSPEELAAIHAILGPIRRTGVAILPGARRASKITSMAVAVTGPRGPIAAISLAHKGNLPPERVAPSLHQAARRTAARLFPPLSRSRSQPTEMAVGGHGGTSLVSRP